MSRKIVHLYASNSKPQRVPMDQLGFFMNMARSYLSGLDPEREAHFWEVMHTDCPDLMQAVDANFHGTWNRITFTRDLISPAFDPDLVFGGDQEQSLETPRKEADDE